MLIYPHRLKLVEGVLLYAGVKSFRHNIIYDRCVSSFV